MDVRHRIHHQRLIAVDRHVQESLQVLAPLEARHGAGQLVQWHRRVDGACILPVRLRHRCLPRDGTVSVCRGTGRCQPAEGRDGVSLPRDGTVSACRGMGRCQRTTCKHENLYIRRITDLIYSGWGITKIYILLAFSVSINPIHSRTTE